MAKKKVETTNVIPTPEPAPRPIIVKKPTELELLKAELAETKKKLAEKPVVVEVKTNPDLVKRHVEQMDKSRAAWMPRKPKQGESKVRYYFPDKANRPLRWDEWATKEQRNWTDKQKEEFEMTELDRRNWKQKISAKLQDVVK